MAFLLRFLIDECVSPTLVSEAKARSLQAWHVNHRKLGSRPDLNLFRRCLEEDLVLVTNNARDFLPLYAASEIHPGLVILLPVVERDAQRRLFAAVLDAIASSDNLINKLVRVDAAGLVTLSDLPAP